MSSELLKIRSHWLSKILLIFIATRLLLIAAGMFSHYVIAEDASPAHWHDAPDNLLVDMWGRWDSGWYLDIANKGYSFVPGTQSPVAFFPGYPLLVSLLSKFLGDTMIAGLLVSNVALLIALIYLYQLAALEFNDSDAALRTVLYIALFPTTLFFSAIYSESVFLLFSVMAFYYARRQQWAYAGLSGGLCAATRVVGIVMAGAVVLLWLEAHGWRWRAILERQSWVRLWREMTTHLQQILLIGLIPLGLLAYMLYLKINFNDPMAFLTTQKQWDNTPTGPINVIYQTVADLLAGKKAWSEPTWLDLIAFFGAFYLSIVAWRRFGVAYGVYGLLCILIPISSTPRSMIRYVLIIFPIFMALAAWGRYRWWHWIVTIGFTILACIFMITYVSWRFVG